MSICLRVTRAGLAIGNSLKSGVLPTQWVFNCRILYMIVFSLHPDLQVSIHDACFRHSSDNYTSKCIRSLLSPSFKIAKPSSHCTQPLTIKRQRMHADKGYIQTADLFLFFNILFSFWVKQLSFWVKQHHAMSPILDTASTPLIL